MYLPTIPFHLRRRKVDPGQSQVGFSDWSGSTIKLAIVFTLVLPHPVTCQIHNHPLIDILGDRCKASMASLASNEGVRDVVENLFNGKLWESES
jgi:hypothetical protein